jgi:hypothetical protein
MMRNLALMLGLVVAVGCELPETEVTDPVPAVPAAGDEPTGDAAEWAAIRWHGEGASSSATQVMTLSATIQSGGRYVRFGYDRFPWRSMGLGHFFWWNGSTWQGGKFDWIRVGGQGLKTLENIHGGYNGLRVPRSGTPVAFAWTSADGRQRSNLAKTTWP